MEIIKAYKCSDGSIKDNKRDALLHERMLEIRGVIQAKPQPVTLSTTAVAQLIIAAKDEIQQILRKFDKQLCQMNPPGN